MITTPLIGLGDVQRAALILLYRKLNSIAEEVNDIYRADDEATAALFGRPYTPVTIEPIRSENFFEGHHPSLLRAGIDRFPSCSAWSVRATPAANSMVSDHAAVYSDLLYVDLMVKAIENETLANLRAQRMAEAANVCLMQDPTLGGRVTGFLSDPTIKIGDIQIKRENTTYGDVWYWQPVRLEYLVRKDAQNPSVSPGRLFFKGIPYDIDQA